MKVDGVSKPLARRDFLRISSKAMMLTAAGALVDPKSLFAGRTRSAISAPAFNPLVALGYAAELPRDGGSVSVASADRILSPDPLFISRGARVSVVGSGRAPSQKNEPGSLYLDALFPAVSGAAKEDRRFRFWSMTGQPDNDTFSADLSFAIPVLATTGLSFTARYRRPDVPSVDNATEPPPVEEDNGSFTLSLGGSAGPNLQSGVYVVALRESGDELTVDWSRVRLTAKGGSVALTNANFAYVILQVGYGDVAVNSKHSAT